MTILKKHWPLVLAVCVLWLTVAVLLALSVRRNAGHLIYAQDDPYIHMAIARNFSQYGVWGITRHGFTSSSSSPLWTLLLSGVYSVFGPNEIAPLLLNLLFGTAVLFLIHAPLLQARIRPGISALILLLVIFLTPLPFLIFCGQEHTMHTAMNLLVAGLAVRVLSGQQRSPGRMYLLLLSAPLLVMTRYEGLFLLLVVCLLLLARRRPVYAVCVGLVGVAPVVIYGLVSVSRGWHFLPNPILLKGNVPDFSSLRGLAGFAAFSIYREIVLGRPEILVLLLATLVLFVLGYEKQRGFWKEDTNLLALFILCALLHAQLARTSPVNRYEAYLVAFGIFAIGYSFGRRYGEGIRMRFDRDLWPKYLAAVCAAILALSPLVKRGALSLARTPKATTNIYEQQYQMGLFLQRFYEGRTVAANDIGAINYLADIECLDLWGLGNLEVAQARMRKQYRSDEMAALARSHSVAIAIVYDHWFDPVPPAWIKVGAWTIRDNVACGGETVSFYAVDTKETDSLVANLKANSPRLPKSVKQTKPYVK